MLLDLFAGTNDTLLDGEDTCEACNAEMDSIINIAIHGAMREFQTGGFQDRKCVLHTLPLLPPSQLSSLTSHRISSAQPVTSAPVVFKATPVKKPSYAPTATRTPAFPKPVNSSFSPAPKPSPATLSRKYTLFCPECGTKNDDGNPAIYTHNSHSLSSIYR